MGAVGGSNGVVVPEGKKMVPPKKGAQNEGGEADQGQTAQGAKVGRNGGGKQREGQRTGKGEREGVGGLATGGQGRGGNWNVRQRPQGKRGAGGKRADKPKGKQEKA